MMISSRTLRECWQFDEDEDQIVSPEGMDEQDLHVDDFTRFDQCTSNTQYILKFSPGRKEFLILQETLTYSAIYPLTRTPTQTIVLRALGC